jgi:hypothetical protein
MRSKINLVLACILLTKCIAAQKEHFDITIIQDSIVYTPDLNHVVKLQKKIFKVQVALQNIEGIYLYAAFKDSIYSINDKETVPGFKDVPPMSMAEESFNPDQELIISDDGWAYWFYNEKEDWHRFDKDITIAGKTITGTKSVKQFYLTATEKSLPVAEVVEPLYLFFFSAKENKKHELVKELQRYKLKIDWL